MIFAFSISIESRRGRRFWRRRISLLSFIVVIVTVFFLQRFGVWKGMDVHLTQGSPTQSVVIHKRPGQGDVHHLRVWISGDMDGDGTVSLVAAGRSVRTGEIAGVVDLEWQQDWYSDSAELRFVLEEGQGGSIRVTHEFRDH